MSARAHLPIAAMAVLALLLTACPRGPAPETPRTTTTPEATATEAATRTPRETPRRTAESTPEATPAPTEQAHEFSVEELFSHIPPDLVQFCPEDQAEEGMNTEFNTIEVRCDLPDDAPATDVRYTLLEDPAELRAMYRQKLEGYGVERNQGECPTDIPSEASYSTQGAEDVGRFACAIIVNGGPNILWTDKRFAMIMEASNARGGDMATLHEWWAGPESGPVEGE